MPTVPHLLAVTVSGGWLPVVGFLGFVVLAAIVGGLLHSGRAHHGPRHDDRGIASDLAEFAAFRSALRPARTPARVDDRPAVVLRPTGSDPSRR